MGSLGLRIASGISRPSLRANKWDPQLCHLAMVTTWEYSNLTLSPTSSFSHPLPGCSNLTVSATVCNTGSVGSDEVSQSCELGCAIP